MVQTFFGRVINYWTPFLFVSVLCVMLFLYKDAAWPAFFCFLPMAFYFLSQSLTTLDTERNLLEKRVKTLEEQLSALRLEVEAAA